MASDPAASGDSPSLRAILDVLDDPDCRAILRHTGEPMTAPQLLEAIDVSRSTLYRKLDRLSEASLLREDVTVNPGGGRTTHYRRHFEDVTISIDDDRFAVDVERPGESAEDRLLSIWSDMGEQL